MRFQAGELGSWTIRCVLTAYIQERLNSNQSLSQSTMDYYLVRYVYSVALRSEYIITWREVDPCSQMVGVFSNLSMRAWRTPEEDRQHEVMSSI